MFNVIYKDQIILSCHTMQEARIGRLNLSQSQKWELNDVSIQEVSQ